MADKPTTKRKCVCGGTIFSRFQRPLDVVGRNWFPQTMDDERPRPINAEMFICLDCGFVAIYVAEMDLVRLADRSQDRTDIGTDSTQCPCIAWQPVKGFSSIVAALLNFLKTKDTQSLRRRRSD